MTFGRAPPLRILMPQQERRYREPGGGAPQTRTKDRRVFIGVAKNREARCQLCKPESARES